MVRGYFASGLIVLTTIFVPGCGIEAGKPALVFQRDNNVVPPLKTVDAKGFYALFPGNGISPLDSAYLNPGDTYGFTRSEGKTVGAYTKAGASRTIPLDGVLTTEYIWKYEGEKQP